MIADYEFSQNFKIKNGEFNMTD